MPPARTDRPSGSPGSTEVRNAFEIDRDRLLYSVPFRRLAGVTQVVSPREGEIFHNRLTHSVKVAQIARRLAEMLLRKQKDIVEAWGGIDPEVTEAAALAHDLGHPPFGHIAEEELGHLVSHMLCEADGGRAESETYEGYEGNAQSFRIITALAVRRPETPLGLDLTRATLNATLKYPWGYGANAKKPHKYGFYECDKQVARFAREGYIAAPHARSVEAHIMDWADDITYSVHDIEDFYRAGLIPLDRLAVYGDERDRFRNSLRERVQAEGIPINMDATFDKIFAGLFRTLKIRDRYEGTRDQQELLNEFVSKNISRFVTATTLVPPPGTGSEAISVPEDLKLEVFLLKQLIWTYVIENPALAAHQLGQRRAIQTLFREFNSAAVERRWPLFPPFFRERAKKLYEEKAVHGQIPPVERSRLVADTISSMTDLQALLTYQQFSGVSASSMLEPVVT